jgi:predicted RNA-binding protein with PUA domain
MIFIIIYLSKNIDISPKGCYHLLMVNYKKTAFLCRGFTQLHKEQQDYLRNLARSLLSIQDSGEAVPEKRNTETLIIVREDGRPEGNTAAPAGEKDMQPKSQRGLVQGEKYP